MNPKIQKKHPIDINSILSKIKFEHKTTIAHEAVKKTQRP